MTDTFDYSTIIVSDISINGTLHKYLSRVVPLGTIIAWHDTTTIPNGWSLCNGSGTYTDDNGQQKKIPDLRSKFIIGYDSRDTSFNIDTSNSTILHKVSESDPNLPRSAFTLGDVNDSGSTSSEKDNIYFHLAYIICTGDPFTSSVCDRKVEGNLTGGGGAILSNKLTAIDISVNSHIIDNSVNVNINTDTSYNFGRSLIGYNGYDLSSVSFSHIDHDSSNNYCLKHDNSANTLINTIFDKSISFNIGNINKGTINTSGNLGINSTNPFSQLEIGGSVSIGSLYSSTSSTLSNNLIIEGNVGIGLTSPSSILSIYDSNEPYIELRMDSEEGSGSNSLYIYNNSTNSYINNANATATYGYDFYINNTHRMRIKDNQNIGIGCQNALKSVLDVAGAVSVGSSTEWSNISSDPSNAPSNSLVVAGSLGIGLDRVPYSELEVNGSILGHGVIPLGGIIMWSGTIQSGYPLENGVIHYNFVRCQGQTINGIAVPDLRDKFIMGVDSNIGATGGQHTVTLQISNLPAHTHGFTIHRGDDFNFSNHFGGPHFLGSDQNVNQTGGGGSGNLTQGGNYSYTTAGTSPDALSTPYDNRPTYYTLLYLIRIA